MVYALNTSADTYALLYSFSHNTKHFVIPLWSDSSTRLNFQSQKFPSWNFWSWRLPAFLPVKLLPKTTRNFNGEPHLPLYFPYRIHVHKPFEFSDFQCLTATSHDVRVNSPRFQKEIHVNPKYRKSASRNSFFYFFLQLSLFMQVVHYVSLAELKTTISGTFRPETRLCKPQPNAAEG